MFALLAVVSLAARGRRPGGAAAQDGPGMDDELDDYSSRVLDVVDAIPPGQVMSYGDIAEYLEAGGPRQVGRVLASYGGAVRVVAGDPRGRHPGARARQPRRSRNYLAEGTPLRAAPHIPPGRPVRVDMRRARWSGDRGNR